MRIKSVALENHGDITILRSNVVYKISVDIKLALGNVLKACDHAQRGGFSAAGGTYKHDKLAVFYFKIEILNGKNASLVNSKMGCIMFFFITLFLFLFLFGVRVYFYNMF